MKKLDTTQNHNFANQSPGKVGTRLKPKIYGEVLTTDEVSSRVQEAEDPKAAKKLRTVSRNKNTTVYVNETEC